MLVTWFAFSPTLTYIHIGSEFNVPWREFDGRGHISVFKGAVLFVALSSGCNHLWCCIIQLFQLK